MRRVRAVSVLRLFASAPEFGGSIVALIDRRLDSGSEVAYSNPSAEQLDEIPYIDRPDIEIPHNSEASNGAGPSESVSMPFKYVKGDDGNPMLPKVSLIMLAGRLFG